MKIEIFFGKGKIPKIFQKSEIFSEIGGKSETRGQCIIAPERKWMPLSKCICVCL